MFLFTVSRPTVSLFTLLSHGHSRVGGGAFLDGKGSQREADHSLPYSSVEAKKMVGLYLYSLTCLDVVAAN